MFYNLSFSLWLVQAEDNFPQRSLLHEAIVRGHLLHERALRKDMAT